MATQENVAYVIRTLLFIFCDLIQFFTFAELQRETKCQMWVMYIA